ncbi:MAG: hypothetical protein KDB02_10150 [Acidimicrobiales bacterium]|nr:hypothetical protein [Acidimicrobiales bacterium]
MSLRWRFEGRRAELDAVEHDLDAGIGTVIYAGPGVGKTALANQVVERLTSRGRRVERVIGSTPQPFPLQAFAPLIAAGADTDIDTFARTALITEKLRAEPGAPKTVLLVDDAQFLDESSINVLLQLAGGEVVVILATVRAEHDASSPSDLARLWSGDTCRRLDLAPLGVDDCDRLLRYALGGDVDLRAVHTLVDHAHGNTFLLRELVLASVSDGVLRRSNNVWILDGLPSTGRGVADLVSDRLNLLDPELRAALDAIAVGEPLRLRVAEHLVGTGHLEALEAEHLIVCAESSGEPMISVAHSTLAKVVRDTLPRTRLRRLHLDLARLFERSSPDPVAVVRSARWRLAEGVACDPHFLMTAAAAARTFDLSTAEVLARAAADQDPSVEAVTLLASILTSAGRSEEAAELFDLLPPAELERGDQDLVLFMQSVGVGLRAGDPEAGIALLDRPGGSARLRGMQSTLLLLDGAVEKAQRLAAAVLDDPASDGTARAVAGIGAVGSHFYLGASTELRRRFQVAAVDAARESASNPHAIGQIEVNAFCAIAESGSLDEAEALARNRLDEGLQGDDDAGWDRSRWAYVLGRVALIRGNLPEAVRMLRLASATPAPFDLPFHRYNVSFLARALAGMGESADARRAMDAVPTELPRFRLFEPELELAEAAILSADGHLAAAAERAASAAELAAVSHMHGVVVFAAHDAARYGGAALVQHTISDADVTVDGPLLRARLDAVLALARGDAAHLHAVSEAFERIGAALYAAEAAAGAARLYRGDGDATAAVRSEVRFQRLLARCPAAAVPWLSGVTATTPLTKREQETAVLAAAGSSDTEIARHLDLSVRTVQTHLGRVYAKLDIHSRSALAEALLPRDGDRPAGDTT